MDVVLDTNIFMSDWKMQGHEFKVLFDYAMKTGSRIVVPRIVQSELLAHYERKLVEQGKALEDALNGLDRMLVKGITTKPVINIPQAVHDYLESFSRRFGAIFSQTDYKPEYLPEAVKRACYRIPPCSEKGEEFRDTLLWLSVLDYAQDSDQKSVVFISKNIREFGDKDNKSDLHKTLKQEANNRNIAIQYFPNLSEFIKSASSDKYGPNWLYKYISQDALMMELAHYLENVNPEAIKEWESRSSVSPTSGISISDAEFNLDKLYVYQLSDGSYSAEGMFDGNLTLSYYKQEQIGEYEYGEPEFGLFERERHLKFRVVFNFAVNQEKLEDFWVADLDLV